MTKNGLKRIISIALIVVMITTSAPQVVCKAAETAWKIVKNQETPLDEVYFDRKKSDDPAKSYLYGFIDGKVAIIDSDYNLVKKTEFDEIAALKKKVNGMEEYIVSKKVGKQKLYGIISETGEIIVEPKYAYIWSGDNAIQITENESGNNLVGLLSYSDGRQILPCKYKSIWSIGRQDNNMLVVAIREDGSFNAILDKKSIITKKTKNEDEYYKFYFDEYNGQKCILCRFLNYKSNSTKWSYYSYDGTLIKEMSNDEYEKNRDDKENGNTAEVTYKEACNKWLNKAGEAGKKHVEEFYKEKNIELSDVKVNNYYDTDYNDNITHYWSVITGEYKETYDGETESRKIVYSYIYDIDGKCLLSGRGFLEPFDSDNDNLIRFRDSRKGRYLLNDSNWLYYFDKYNNYNIEKLFQIKEDKLPLLDGDSVFKNQHYLNYDYGNVVEKGDGYNRIFVYADKKVYSYDYRDGDYYFINSQDDIKVYHCGVENEKAENMSSYDIEREYAGKLTWDYYITINISANERKNLSIKEKTYSGFLAYNNTDRKVYYFDKNNTTYTFSYEELGLPETVEDEDGNVISGDNYLDKVLSDKNWIYFEFRCDRDKKFFCLNTDTGIVSKISVDENVLEYVDRIFVSGGCLYLYSTYNENITSINTSTFTTKVYTLNNIGADGDERIDTLFSLAGNVYVQYCYDYNYYGVMDLLGKKYIDALSEKCYDKFKIYGDYLYKKGNGSSDIIYDSSLNSVGDYASLDSIRDSRKRDKDGYLLDIDGLYEISCYKSIHKESYTIKLMIYDKNIDKIIYEVDDEADLKDFTQMGNYYIMSVYNTNSKTINRVIVDSTTGEQLYNGKDYIYIDETNKKIVTIKQKEGKIPSSTDEPAVSGAKISVEKTSVKINAGNSVKLKYSAYDDAGKAVKAKAVSSNTKVAKVSVLSTGEIKITVPDNAKKGDTSTITLSRGNKKAEIKITVKAESNKASKLKAKNKKLSAKKGKKLSIIYNYSAKNSEKSLTEDVNIQSSDKSIAKILSKKISNGKITVKVKASKKGEADITVKIGAKTATTKIVVK